MPAAVAVPLITAAVGAGATAYGARSAGKSARRAQDIQTRTDDQTLQFEREREVEARRQWEAQQAFQAQQFAAQEDERRWQRQQQEYQQRLIEEREARQAPYRAASQQALGRLGDILGLSFNAPSPSTGRPVSGAAAGTPARPMDGGRQMLSSRPPVVSGPMTRATEPSYMPVNPRPMTTGDFLNMPRRRAMEY